MVTPAIVIKKRLRGSSYRKLGAELAVSAGHLHHVAAGIKEAGDELVEKLGLERVVIVRYRHKKPAARPAA